MPYNPRTSLTGRIQANTTSGLHMLRATGDFIDNVLAIRNESYSLGDPITLSGVNTSTGALTSAAHGLDLNYSVWIESTGTLPAGLAAQTDYRVVARDTNTFNLSLYHNGAAIIPTTVGTGTITVRTIGRGHSAIILCADNEDPLYGSVALGITRHGSNLFDNSTFFIATNTATLDPTTPAHDIAIIQHEGPAAQQHARAYFDGTAHTTHFPGWDADNARPDNGLYLAEDGRAGFGQLPPDAAFAQVTNTFFGGGISAGITLQDRTNTEDEAWITFANDHTLFFRHYLDGPGDGWQMYSFSGTNEFFPAYDNAWKVGTATNSVREVHSYSYIAKPTSAPGSPVEGQIYYDSGTHHFFGWNGSAWVQFDN